MKIRRLIYILASIILAFVCVLGFALTYKNVYCGIVMAGPQKGIDVMPLYEANINSASAQRLSNLITSDVFGYVENVDDSTISVYSLDNSIHVYALYWTKAEDADSNFKSSCESSVYRKGSAEYGGVPGNRYCISDVLELRAGTDGLCLSRGQYGLYESFVVFQKGNLVITITETTESPNVLNKNKMIIYLAEAFNKQK
jgi:hypothetical protein